MSLSRTVTLWLCLMTIFLAACDALPTPSSIVVKPNEVAVVYAQETGALEDTLYEGTYDIDLLEQSVMFYPLFWQVYSFRDEYTLSDGALGGDAIEARTIDDVEVRVSLSLVFRVNADE